MGRRARSARSSSTREKSTFPRKRRSTFGSFAKIHLEHECGGFAEMLVGQVANHQRRRLRRFDRRERELIPVGVICARFVRGLALPALSFGLFAEGAIAAQFVVEQALEHGQQRNGREMSDQVGDGGELAARGVVTARDQPLAPLLGHQRDNRMRLLRKRAGAVAFLIVATQQFR